MIGDLTINSIGAVKEGATDEEHSVSVDDGLITLRHPRTPPR